MLIPLFPERDRPRVFSGMLFLAMLAVRLLCSLSSGFDALIFRFSLHAAFRLITIDQSEEEGSNKTAPLPNEIVESLEIQWLDGPSIRDFGLQLQIGTRKSVYCSSVVKPPKPKPSLEKRG